MRRKLIDVLTTLPLLIASAFGGLIFLVAFAGHPPEGILDAYYSIFPATAVGGAMALFLFIGVFSLFLFVFSVVRIFRKASPVEPAEGDAPNNASSGRDT